MTLEEQLWKALKPLTLPGFDRKLLAAVQDVSIDDGTATVVLALAHMNSETQQQAAQRVREALSPIDGVDQVRVMVRRRATSPVSAPATRPATHIIVVGSGKGGVGKSSISVNLAVALAQSGQRVGLLDADIFGPNLPRMLGVADLPERSGSNIPPATAHGLSFISVGFLVDASQPVVWRGPMTDKVIQQFLHEVEWGALDSLVIDLPPGTGDIAIAIARHARPDGAIAVTTPQAVAADDARKAVGMFRRLDVPVLGIVENMSYFECDECGTRHALFGEGGGARLADELSIPLLARVPFEPRIQQGGDHGLPIVAAGPSPAAGEFARLAETVRAMLEAPANPSSAQ